MIINSVENGDNFVASSDYQYHKKDVVATGTKGLYSMTAATPPSGKSLVIDDDDLCAIGSYNFDLRSTYMDTELMLVIQSEELTGQPWAIWAKSKRTAALWWIHIIISSPIIATVAEVPFGKERPGRWWASAPAGACAGLRIPEEAEQLQISPE